MGKAIYVVEHKTTSKDIGLGSPYWQRLTLDDQVSTYMAGARMLGHEPRGVLYDVIRKPAERPYEVNSKRSEPEPAEAFAERIREKIGAEPDKYFQRGKVVRFAEEERVAAQNAWIYSQQIIAFRNAGQFPQNVDACETWGRFCDFWGVCAGEKSLDDATLYRKKAELNEELAALSPATDGKKRLPVLSASAMRALRQCPRLYEFKYEQGYEPHERAGALRFGTLIHLALETWWLTNKDLDAAMAKLSGESDPYDLARATELMRGYHVRWSDAEHTVLAVEKEFSGPLVNPETGGVSRTFVRGGKMDAICEVNE
ncbi:PD-(D/E)XK nuclease family protein [bacterium]|nr:PD-(D/E)XK nuclease family protein [bacterium]